MLVVLDGADGVDGAGCVDGAGDVDGLFVRLGMR